MPLLDIATVQPSFQSHLGTLRAQAPFHCILPNKFTFGNAKRLASTWKTFPIPEKFNFNVGRLEIRRGKLLIKAVATLESKRTLQSGDEHKSCNTLQSTIDPNPPVNQFRSSSGDSAEVDEREKLRRMRISKANKGNTPWNKGRKHSAETLQRIRERTRLAMQDPKVKMKLVNLGHSQSKETRKKIGIGVQIGWQRRREKLLLQETCHFDWQNLIAEASRRGYVGEEELQWDSYKILDEQLEQEWLESVEQRKNMPRPKGSKRAPKSPEQRKKISEAISAKWADPGYRDRVCSALSKYHGVPVGAGRKPRSRPSRDTQTRTRRPAKKKSSDAYHSAAKATKSQTPRPRKRSNAPMYKDPLANSKLEMIKNIRAQRVAADTKKAEAIERARVLIAEAEKAAKALEVAALRSPLARASLMETRKLIAEAIQSIESIDAGQNASDQNGRNPSPTSTGLVNNAEHEIAARSEEGRLNGVDKSKVNGNHTLSSSNNQDFDFGKFTLQNLLNADEELLPTSSNGYGLPPLDFDSLRNQVGTQPDQNGKIKLNGANSRAIEEEESSNSNNIARKWVRGRLVEVSGD